jgi:hypothetical protein
LVAAVLDAGVDQLQRAARDGDPAVGLLASQLRAQVFVELVCGSMRREPSDASVPDRYRVAVTVPYDQAGDLGVAGCDAPAFRVVLGAGSDVLDVGRLTKRWPPGIRRAITLRDGGCTFPGCGQPPSRCDIHHTTPWQDGGGTSVDNGALACVRHHVFVHRNGWTVVVEDGRVLTRKPDGTEHVIRRWDPPHPVADHVNRAGHRATTSSLCRGRG